MIREALDRMALHERAVLAGVEVERVTLFGFRVEEEIFDADEVEYAAGISRRVAGRGAKEAREPWELEVAGSIPAVQTGPGVGAGEAQAYPFHSATPPGFDARGPAQRQQERLRAGTPATSARIAELRRLHGRALRVTGQARAKRAVWTKAEAWLVVSYPKEARGT